MRMHQSFAEWASWFWPSFADHLWQTTLVAFIVWIAAMMLRKSSSTARYGVWSIAFLKFVLPSVSLLWLLSACGIDWPRDVADTTESFPSYVSNAATAAYSSVRMIFQLAQPVLEAAPLPATERELRHNEIYCALTVAWVLGVVWFVSQWIFRRWQFARSIRFGRQLKQGRELEALRCAQRWLMMRSEVGLIESDRAHEPGVWRVMRPMIVLPTGLTARLNDEELQTVMMHELIHVLHRDNLVSALQMMVCCLFWFHPIVWLIDRRLLVEREMRCDETVIRLGAEPGQYARSLWKVAQFGLGWPVVGVSHAAGSNLKRRIEHMLSMNFQSTHSLYRRISAGLVIACLVAAAVALSLLAGDSAFAQRKKIRSTSGKTSAGVIPGRVPGGAPDGVPGGVPGGLRGGVPGRVVLKPSGGVEVSMMETDEKQQDGGQNAESLNIVDRAAVDTMPKIRQSSQADYTDEARNNGTKGIVVLSVVFRSDGRIDRVRVIRGLPDGLTEQAIEAAKRTEFEPAMKDGRAVSVQGNIRYTFMTESDGPRPGPNFSELERPVILYREKAQYTEQARENKTEGSVILSVVFGADGNIRDIRVVRGLPDGLTEAAIESARKTRFKPATREGKPVDVRSKLEYTFNFFYN